MHIEELPLSVLQPAPYNPRKPLQPGMPAYERLKRSLTEFELVQPIIWNRTTGHVVGGHQRLRILQERGDATVPCVVVELPLEREKALNVALNNAQVGGDWDQAKLLDLVAELQTLPDFDATLTGFDAADLKHLSFQPVALSPPDDSQEESDDTVHVSLEVPKDDWNSVRTEVDALLVRHPGLRVHVRSLAGASRRSRRRQARR